MIKRVLRQSHDNCKTAKIQSKDSVMTLALIFYFLLFKLSFITFKLST